MPPTLADGKICYLVIPALDIAKSAAFYQTIFHWRIRTRGDGSTAFDDAAGEVSGAWVTGLPPANQPAILIYIMVKNIDVTINDIIAHGGEIVQPVDMNAREITAQFRDIAGNIFGLYQERELP
jgi:predicted enzyme related to lactoylglutathione lyase